MNEWNVCSLNYKFDSMIENNWSLLLLIKTLKLLAWKIKDIAHSQHNFYDILFPKKDKIYMVNIYLFQINSNIQEKQKKPKKLQICYKNYLRKSRAWYKPGTLIWVVSVKVYVALFATARIIYKIWYRCYPK